MYSTERLGKNIKRIRLERGLTQAELGGRLHVTAQNVSKWEKGISLPDVNNLCLLAAALEVTPDRLLGNSEGTGAMIAIDGGGTKTEFCLFSREGEVLGKTKLGATNPNAVGIDTTARLLRAGIDELLSKEPSVEAIFAGVSGCGIEKNRRAVISLLQKSYPDIRIFVDGDMLNLIYSEDYFDECLIAIMGTGSVIAAKCGEQLHRVGGWGYLFDEGFSGFGLGHDAVMAALREQDGLGKKTALTRLLSERLGEKIIDSISLLYSDNNKRIGSYAELVFEAYKTGDEVAAEILEKRVGYLVFSLQRAAELHGGGRHVVLGGGLTTQRQILEKFLPRGHFEFHFPTLPPIYGAARYCAIKCGEISENFGKNFEITYKK